ncbi:MAG: DUF1592 domain-containing protein [Verrucomicrobiota bacterium]
MPLLIRSLFLVLLFLSSAHAEIPRSLERFLEHHAPSQLRLMELIIEHEGEEEIERMVDELFEMREFYDELIEEDGEEIASLRLALLEKEAQGELLLWTWEDRDLEEATMRQKLRGILAEQIEFERRITTWELERLHEEIEELEEELHWQRENPEAALRERMEDLLEHEDEEWDEEEEEWDEEEREEVSGPIYLPAPSQNDSDHELAKVGYDFTHEIMPALEQHCFDCHDSDSAKGDVDLEQALTQTPLVRSRHLWENVAERVRMGDMPPRDKPQPSSQTKQKIRAWIANEVDQFDYRTVRNPGSFVTKRLTREEYNRSIRDLVGLDLRPADNFPTDFSGTSGFSNSGNTLFLQTAHLDRYVTAADAVIDAVRADRDAWSHLTQGTPKEALLRFARRAWRRTPAPDEVHEVISALGTDSRADDALAAAIKIILISPHFLLRTEASGTEGQDQPVSSLDLASRLSYFLWASLPDEELLSAGERGALLDSKQRRRQVDRMLADSRSLALGELFAAEWFGSDDLGPRIRKDPIDNPWCTESLMKAMRDETALFVSSLVRENAPLARLVDADYTFLNAELAKFYRIPGVQGTAMQRVSLTTDQRGGLFGHASILATTSFPHRTSPVVRGTWILETLLGTPPPPPPPNVPEIEVDEEGAHAARSLRQKLERHRNSANCAGCHDQIDPLGFALESYGEFGQWRSGVDDRGTLPNGAQFRGPAGLKLALIDNRLDDLAMQATRNLLAYALGRQLEYYDEGIVRDIAAELEPSGYRFRDLIHAIANSYPFTTKRIPES